MRAFYFGTYERAGHYAWDRDWRSQRWPWASDPSGPLPWTRIDGGLYRDGKEGVARLHHKDGWTALAFPNRMDDSRPGSNAAFFFEATLTFDEALTEAQRVFPHVVKRFAFAIVDADAKTGEQK